MAQQTSSMSRLPTAQAAVRKWVHLPLSDSGLEENR